MTPYEGWAGGLKLAIDFSALTLSFLERSLKFFSNQTRHKHHFQLRLA
jgi:hypothetical protein